MITFAGRMSSVHRSFIREILKTTEDPGIISFAGGLPNPAFFPVKELAEVARAVLTDDGPAALQYSTTEGYPPLRELVAERYARAGVKVSAADILILNGSQQGLDLVGKALLDKGDTVLVERPTYLAAIQAFGMFEPRFCGMELEEDGISTGDLATALAGTKAKLFYAIPNFQNPSGISYSEEKRRQAAALLDGSSTVLLEDDPYGELRFMGTAVPPIKAFSRGQNVALLGTCSKIVSPGLRVGWLCAGPEIMEKLVIAKQAADLQSNGLAQRIVHRFLRSPAAQEHVERIRAGYRAQRDLMVELVGALFPPEVRCTKPEGGMFLWMTLPEGMSAFRLFERALEQKVAFVPGQAFFAGGGGENTLRLNFSNASTEGIREGMERLARVYRTLR
jgi:2-aminoadipate transaminase